MSRIFCLSAIFILIGMFALSACSHQKKLSEPRRPTPNEEYFDAIESIIQDSSDSTKKTLKKLTEKYPKDPEYYNLLSIAYSEENKLDSSIFWMEKAITLDTTNQYYWSYYYNLLQRYRANPAELIRTAKYLTELKNDGESWFKLALAYYWASRPDSVISICQRHYDQLKGKYAVEMLMASSYGMMDQCDSAMQVVSKLVNSPQGEASAFFFAAETSRFCAEDSITMRYFNRGLELGCPDDEGLIEYLKWLTEKKYSQEAIDLFEKVYENCQVENYICNEIINLFSYTIRKELMQTDKVKQLVGSIFKRFGNENKLLLTQFRYYNFTQDTANALKLIRKLSEKDPNSYMWWSLRLSIEQDHRDRDSVTDIDWVKSTYTLRRMRELFPFDIAPSFLYAEKVYATTYSRARQLDTIRMLIQEQESALKYAKSNESYFYTLEDSTVRTINKRKALTFNISSLYGYMGDVYSQWGKLKQSYKQYKKALKYNPDNANVLNNYAYSLAENDVNSLNEAERMSRKSLLIEKDNVNALDTYGYILYRLGRYEEARKVFIKLFSIDPNPLPTVLFHYADLLDKLGKSNSADLYRMKAKEFQPDI